MMKGQGLVEIIVALAVMVIGLTAILALTSQNLAVGRESERRLIATNFAREGVEIVRNIRDDNRLASDPDPLNTSLKSGTDYTAIPIFDTSTFAWSLDFTANQITDDAARIYRSGNFYVQAISQPGGSTITLYRRLLTLNEICKDGNIRTSGNFCGASGAPDEKIGIQVLSQVQWAGSIGTRNTIVEDRIYKW
jgi:Tfp pilus assembly protein PilV